MFKAYNMHSGVIMACHNVLKKNFLSPNCPDPLALALFFTQNKQCFLFGLAGLYFLSLPGPTSQWARVWSRSHKTGPSRGSCAQRPALLLPARQLPPAPALPLLSPAGCCSWRSGAAGRLQGQVKVQVRWPNRWPPPHPCWVKPAVRAAGTGRRHGSTAGPAQHLYPSGMRAQSGCACWGHSQPRQATPECGLAGVQAPDGSCSLFFVP